MDRFHLVGDVIDRLPGLGSRGGMPSGVRNKLIEHRLYIMKHGDDMPEVRGWRSGQGAAEAAGR